MLVSRLRSKRVPIGGKGLIKYIVPVQLNDDFLQPRRHYRVTKVRENPLIFGGVGIVVAALGVQVGLKAYEEFQASRKLNESESEESRQAEEAGEKVTGNSDGDAGEARKTKAKEDDKGPGLFSSFFATTFYDGGFEDKMTKREAALILGVRESASVDRIKDAHRRILINNHPDRGGSPFIASKVNEAKDFLLKGQGVK